ncbi:MAG: hypothetical protein DBX47_02150 [Clostridiales bacterium]|nr:MAG: hypothetical protein DBX47_02150 [Clostridiales bacterium]
MKKLEQAIEILHEKNDSKALLSVFNLLSQFAQEGAQFIVPINVKEEKTENLAPEQGKKDKMNFTLCTVTTSEKGVYFPAFTTKDESSKGQDSSTITLPIIQLFDFTLKQPSVDGIILNPFGASLILNKEMISDLASDIQDNSSVQEFEAEKDVPVKYGIPNPHPEKLTEVAADVMRGMADVLSAYLLTAKRGEETSYLMIVDADTSDLKTLFAKIYNVCGYYSDIPIDFVPLEPFRKIVSKIQPFYIK